MEEVTMTNRKKQKKSWATKPTLAVACASMAGLYGSRDALAQGVNGTLYINGGTQTFEIASPFQIQNVPAGSGGFVVGNNNGAAELWIAPGANFLVVDNHSNDASFVEGGGVFYQTGGTTTLPAAFSVAPISNQSATANLVGGTFTISPGSGDDGSIYVGQAGTGIFSINGAAVSATNLYVAPNSNSNGIFHMNSGTLSVNNLVVGQGASGSSATLYLNGGYINAGNFSVGAGATFDWSAGTLNIYNSSVSVGSAGLPWGTNTIASGQALTTQGVNVSSTLYVYGSVGASTINVTSGNFVAEAGSTVQAYSTLSLSSGNFSNSGTTISGGVTQTGGTLVQSLGAFNSSDYTLTAGTLNQQLGMMSLAQLDVGTGTGNSGTVSVTSGTMNVNSGGNQLLRLGVGGGTGNFTQSGTGFSTVTTSSLWIGEDSGGQVSAYTLNGNNATLSVTGDLILGYGSGSSGVLNISSGTLNDSAFANIGQSGTGLLNQTGGSSIFSSDVNIGQSSNSTGTFNQSGGSSTFSTNLNIAPGNNSTGTFSLSAGTAATSATVVNNVVVGGSSSSLIGVGRFGTLNIIGNGASAPTLSIGGNLRVLANSAVHQTGGVVTVPSVSIPAAPSPLFGSLVNLGFEYPVYGTIVNNNPDPLQTFTVNGTQEVSNWPSAAGWNFNVSANRIVMTFNITGVQPNAYPYYGWQLSDLGDNVLPITGVTIDAATTVPGVNPSLITFDANDINFNMSGLSVSTLTKIQLDLTFGTDNQGSYQLSGGTLNTSSLDTGGNPGSFNWTSGTLNLSNTSLTIGSGGPLGSSLTLSAGKTLIVGDTLTNNGAVTLNGGSLTASNLSGNSIVYQSGSLSVAGPITIGNGGALGTTVTVSANQSIGSTTGTTVTASGTLNVSGGTVTGPFTNAGTLAISGNSTFANAVTSSGSVSVSSAAVTYASQLTITGGTYISDPSVNSIAGLNIASGATVTGSSGDQFIITGGNTLTNAGTFNDAGSLSAAAVTNSGSFVVGNGLTETGNFNNSGTVSIGRTQNWSSGAVFTNTAGTATFSSDTGAGGANLAFNISGGTVNFNSTQNLNSLAMTGGSISIQSTATVNTPSMTISGGTETISGGTLKIAGTLVADGTLAINNAAVVEGTGSGGVVNIGTNGVGNVVVTGAGSVLSASQYIHVGTFYNGTLLVINGGQVTTAGNLYIAGNNFATSPVTGTLILGTAGSTDAGSSLNASGGIFVGDIGQGGAIQTGILNVYGGTTVNTPGTLYIQNTTPSSVNLAGGTISVGALNTEGVPSTFNWSSGTLNLTNSSLTIGTGGLLGSNLTLNSNQNLSITGAAQGLNISGGGVVNIAGGTFNNSGTTVIGLGSYGTINQTGGTSLFSSLVNIGLNGGANGTFNLSGGTATASGGVNDGTSAGLGGGGLYVSGSGNLNVGGTLTVYNGDTLTVTGGGQVMATSLNLVNNRNPYGGAPFLNLTGGILSVGSLNNSAGASVNWTSGTLNITGVGASSIGSLTIPSGGILNLYANVGSGILVRNLGAITLSAESAQMNVLGTSNSHNRQLIVMELLSNVVDGR